MHNTHLRVHSIHFSVVARVLVCGGCEQYLLCVDHIRAFNSGGAPPPSTKHTAARSSRCVLPRHRFSRSPWTSAVGHDDVGAMPPAWTGTTCTRHVSFVFCSEGPMHPRNASPNYFASHKSDINTHWFNNRRLVTVSLKNVALFTSTAVRIRAILAAR